MYSFDEKQFWLAYQDRKGYQITRNETKIAKAYDDMIIFMCEVLPLTYKEIASFGYKQFFRTLRTAQKIAKMKENQVNAMKRKAKR